MFEFAYQNYANIGTQFLLNSAIWKYECKANERLGEEVGEMDEESPIGFEMLRTIVCSWASDCVDPYQRN